MGSPEPVRRNTHVTIEPPETSCLHNQADHDAHEQLYYHASRKNTVSLIRITLSKRVGQEPSDSIRHRAGQNSTKSDYTTYRIENTIVVLSESGKDNS